MVAVCIYDKPGVSKKLTFETNKVSFFFFSLNFHVHILIILLFLPIMQPLNSMNCQHQCGRVIREIYQKEKRDKESQGWVNIIYLFFFSPFCFGRNIKLISIYSTGKRCTSIWSISTCILLPKKKISSWIFDN